MAKQSKKGSSIAPTLADLILGDVSPTTNNVQRWANRSERDMSVKELQAEGVTIEMVNQFLASIRNHSGKAAQLLRDTLHRISAQYAIEAVKNDSERTAELPIAA